jgi:predicted nuclease of predicted toxin-antitoxin system
VDVLTCQEAGMLAASDKEQLAFAARTGRIVFTHDTDFLKLHSEGVAHAGIVYSPNQLDIGGNISI